MSHPLQEPLLKCIGQGELMRAQVDLIQRIPRIESIGDAIDTPSVHPRISATSARISPRM